MYETWAGYDKSPETGPRTSSPGSLTVCLPVCDHIIPRLFMEPAPFSQRLKGMGESQRHTFYGFIPFLPRFYVNHPISILSGLINFILELRSQG